MLLDWDNVDDVRGLWRGRVLLLRWCDLSDRVGSSTAQNRREKLLILPNPVAIITHKDKTLFHAAHSDIERVGGVEIPRICQVVV